MTEQNEYEAPDMETYFAVGLDDQKATEAEKELLPPTDTYISTPPLVVAVSKYEAKDGRPERVVFRAYGAFKGKNTGKEIRQTIQFTPQLQKFAKDNGEEVYDGASQNYLKLRQAYKKVFGVFPATVGDIKSYVEAYPVGIRGVKYDGRNGPAFGVFNIFSIQA